MPARRVRGALESDVLRILWDAGEPLTSRQIRERFVAQGEDLALTTILTVLDRLGRKGVVSKTNVGAGYLFASTRTESAEAAGVMQNALEGVSDRQAALLQFAGGLTTQDLAVLREAVTGQPGTPPYDA